jgi:hypothetical protein
MVVEVGLRSEAEGDDEDGAVGVDPGYRGEMKEAGGVRGGEAGEEGAAALRGADGSAGEAVVGGGDGGFGVEVGSQVTDVEGADVGDGGLEVDAFFWGDA